MLRGFSFRKNTIQHTLPGSHTPTLKCSGKNPSWFSSCVLMTHFNPFAHFPWIYQGPPQRSFFNFAQTSQQPHNPFTKPALQFKGSTHAVLSHDVHDKAYTVRTNVITTTILCTTAMLLKNELVKSIRLFVFSTPCYKPSVLVRK